MPGKANAGGRQLRQPCAPWTSDSGRWASRAWKGNPELAASDGWPLKNRTFADRVGRDMQMSGERVGQYA